MFETSRSARKLLIPNRFGVALLNDRTGQPFAIRATPLAPFIVINSIAVLAVRLLHPDAVFSRLQDSVSARCQPETAAAARSVRNANNRVFRAVQIFLCCIRVSTVRVFSMGASDYQCDEPDVLDLANDLIVANSASLQPLEAKLRRSPETPRVIKCRDTIGSAAWIAVRLR